MPDASVLASSSSATAHSESSSSQALASSTTHFDSSYPSASSTSLIAGSGTSAASPSSSAGELASSGLAGSSSSTGTSTGMHTGVTINVAGSNRQFDYYVPDNLGTAAPPLVLLLHGHGGSSVQISGQDGKKAPYKKWLTIADANKILVAFPQGLAGSDGKLGWNDCRGDASTNPTSDDVAFLDALITWFEEHHSIDSRRVYASGTSNGGHMALRLALELSQRVTAVAPVVAALPASSACTTPTRAVPVLFMNGTADPILPWAGGTMGSGDRGSVLSAEASAQWWVEHNGASPTATTTDVADLDTDDGCTVVRHHHAGSAPVVLYQINGGGHTEPSIQEQYSAMFLSIVGKQDHDMEMATEVWNFFKDLTR